MKYEMIFGDEKLFDGAPEDAEVSCKTTRPCNVDFVYYKDFSKTGFFFFGSSKKWLHSESTPAYMFSAMRRIIKEPKRWTWEDKKAGRLPEVLGKVTTYDGKTYLFVGESCHDNQWSLKDDATGKVYHTPIGDIFPIETPAEKAQRLEEEFVRSVCSELDGTSLQHCCIYERGVRAAYRKLKGGE